MEVQAALEAAFTKWCLHQFDLETLATPLKHVHQASQGHSQHQVSLEPIEEESQGGGSRKRARSLAPDFDESERQKELE